MVKGQEKRKGLHGSSLQNIISVYTHLIQCWLHEVYNTTKANKSLPWMTALAPVLHQTAVSLVNYLEKQLVTIQHACKNLANPISGQVNFIFNIIKAHINTLQYYLSFCPHYWFQDQVNITFASCSNRDALFLIFEVVPACL